MSALSEYLIFFQQHYSKFSKLSKRQQRHLLREYSILNRRINIETDTTLGAHPELTTYVRVVLSVMSLSPVVRDALQNVKTISLAYGNNTECTWYVTEIQCNFSQIPDIHGICFMLCEALYRRYLTSSYLQKTFLSGISQLETALFYRSEKTNNAYWSELCYGLSDVDPLKWFASASEMYFFHFDQLDQLDRDLYDSLEMFWRATLIRRVLFKKEKKFSSTLHPVYSVYTLISFFVGSFFLLYLLQFVLLETWVIICSVLFLSTTGFIVRHLFIRFNIPIIVIPFIFFTIFGLGVVAFDIMLISNMVFAKQKPEKVVYIPYSYLKHQTRKQVTMEQVDHVYAYEYTGGITRQVVFESKHFQKPEHFVIVIQKGLWGMKFISKTYVTYVRE